MDDTEILESLTKSVGFVEKQKVRCGRKNCKCVKGKDYWHGPYCYYRFWKLENGKYFQKKLYINSATYDKLKNVLELYKYGYAGSHGNYKLDRRNVVENILNGADLNQKGLDAYTMTVDSFAKLYNSG